MSSSKNSSFSETESITENDVSYEEEEEERPVEKRPQEYYQYYVHHPQNPSVRYVVTGSSSSLRDGVSFTPNFNPAPQTQAPAPKPNNHQQYTKNIPMTYVDGNHMPYRAYSNFNQNTPLYAQSNPAFTKSNDFSTLPQPEVTSTRYVTSNTFAVKANEVYSQNVVSMQNQAVHYIPNNEKKIFYVDSYRVNGPSLNYYPPHYNQQTIKVNNNEPKLPNDYMRQQQQQQQQSQILNYDNKHVQSTGHSTIKSHSQVFKPVASQWSMSGGTGNYGSTQKFYKDLNDSSNTNMSPYYQESSSVKEKRNFLSYNETINNSPKRRKYAVYIIISFLLITALLAIGIFSAIINKGSFLFKILK